MSFKSLNIEWSMTNPIEKKDSFKWNSNPLTQDGYKQIEKKLSWPENTIGILEQAFKNKLARATSWENISTSKEAFEKAADIYKRAVPIEGKKNKSISGSYEINLMSKQRDIVSSLDKYDSLIIDFNLYEKWEGLFSKLNKPTFVVETSESKKNLETFSNIVSFFRSIDSKSTAIIGGGILGDTASFAATEAGVGFDLYPSTTLSIFDACVGGKTGINFFPYGKNLLGRFAFPNEVKVYTPFLNTLEQREFNAGIYEGLKHCLLKGDRKLFSKLLDTTSKQKIDDQTILEVIKVKAEVIKQDANETSIRATLNLGHTFAHALEVEAHKRDISLLHGEAVLIGLIFCIILSKNILKTNELERFSELVGLLKSKHLLEINDFVQNLNIEEIYDYILNDKKNLSNSNLSNWILLTDWGVVNKNKDSYLTPVEKKEIESCLEDLQLLLNNL